MGDFMQGRYYSLNEYLCKEFGGKVYKLALDIGCTCPNRDGTKDNRGCIFCHNGSSHFAEMGVDINTQIENAKNRVKTLFLRENQKKCTKNEKKFAKHLQIQKKSLPLHSL